MRPSVGRAGDADDNALAKSLIGSLDSPMIGRRNHRDAMPPC
jgi:hypothetical protein